MCMCVCACGRQGFGAVVGRWRRYGTFVLYFLYVFIAINPSFSVMELCILVYAFVIMLVQLSIGVHKAVHPMTYSPLLCRVRRAAWCSGRRRSQAIPCFSPTFNVKTF